MVGNSDGSSSRTLPTVTIPQWAHLIAALIAGVVASAGYSFWRPQAQIPEHLLQVQPRHVQATVKEEVGELRDETEELIKDMKKSLVEDVGRQTRERFYASEGRALIHRLDAIESRVNHMEFLLRHQGQPMTRIPRPQGYPESKPGGP